MMVTMTTLATFVIFNFVWHGLAPDERFGLTFKEVGHFLVEKIGEVGEVHAIAFLLTAFVWVAMVAIEEMMNR